MDAQGEKDFERETLAGQETQAVRRLRSFLFAILILAVIATVAVYSFTTKREKNDFKLNFAGQGQKVIQGFQDDSFRKLQAMDTLSGSFTTFAKASGSTWPFVTMPDSANHFESYLSLADAASLTLLPIIGQRERLDWEEYAVANQGWLDRDLIHREELHENEGSGRVLSELSVNNRRLQTTAETIRDDVDDTMISPFIKSYVGVDTSRGPWIVWW